MNIDIKAIRDKHKLTQQQLADQIGVNQSTIARLERGQVPSGPVKRLLEALNDQPLPMSEVVE